LVDDSNQYWSPVIDVKGVDILKYDMNLLCNILGWDVGFRMLDLKVCGHVLGNLQLRVYNFAVGSNHKLSPPCSDCES